jgi:hypothetical protein
MEETMDGNSGIDELLRKIERIKRGIERLGVLRPGTLSKQYNVCGNPNCACKDKKNPKRHGPYYQLSYTRKGRSRTEFVRKEELPCVRKQLKDYATLLRLKDEWVECSLEIAKLRKDEAKKKAQ